MVINCTWLIGPLFLVLDIMINMEEKKNDDEENEENEENNVEYDYKQGTDNRDAKNLLPIIEMIVDTGIYNNHEIASYCMSNFIIDKYPILSEEIYNDYENKVKILDVKTLFLNLKLLEFDLSI